ncbi:Fe-S cluster assembly protein SufD [Amorphus sp. 3PC139-8]|uniref:Fe-S cluster assembly protein SufD n=1 Tax=Amorphus sp. 3PC139-8 TaxID=2735676 RepID=UPI00345C9843
MAQDGDTNRTAAETALFEWFAAEAGTRAEEGSIGAQRQEAFDRFSGQGLPHRRVEAYKYTDLRATLRTLPPVAEAPASAELETALAAVPPLGGEELVPSRIVIANGRFVPEASDLAALDGAVSVRGFAELLLAADPVLGRIGTLASEVDDPMLALNTALFEDGVVITVADGATVNRPLEILHVATGSDPVTTMPRHAVFVGEGASVRILERYEGAGEAAHVTNAAIELAVAPRASVVWAKLQADGTSATHIGTTTVAIGTAARLNHLTINLGAKLSRSQIFARVDGEETDIAFDTATFITGKQHADQTLVVDHKVPNGVSRERFRSVVDDQAKAIVQGRINVWQYAQKTDARMMSNALLLSEGAEAVNKPELEIFADDVQCAHGATAGQIDEDALFYLRSRGVPKRLAERLLIESFLVEAVEGLGDDTLVPALSERLRSALRGE